MSQAKQSQLWAFLTLPDFFGPCRVGLTFSHAYLHPRHKHKPQEPKDQTGTISKFYYSHVRVSNCRNGVNSVGHHWHGRHGKVVCPHILQSRLEKVLKALFGPLDHTLHYTPENKQQPHTNSLFVCYLSRCHLNSVNVCDMPNKYEQLRQEFDGTGITVMKDGHLVSRQSDWILYSVPAEFIDNVVATYGPCTCKRPSSF